MIQTRSAQWLEKHAKDLLTMKHVLTELGISRNAALKAIRLGRLKAYEFSIPVTGQKIYYVSPEAVEEYKRIRKPAYNKG